MTKHKTTWNVFHNENFTLYFRNTPSNWLELNRWKTSDQRPNFSSWIPALSLSCSIFSLPFPTGRTQGQTNILLVYKRGRTAIKFPSDFRFLVLDIFLFLSSAPTSTIVLFPFPTLPNKGFHFFLSFDLIKYLFQALDDSAKRENAWKTQEHEMKIIDNVREIENYHLIWFAFCEFKFDKERILDGHTERMSISRENERDCSISKKL